MTGKVNLAEKIHAVGMVLDPGNRPHQRLQVAVVRVQGAAVWHKALPHFAVSDFPIG
jgi:hypothetical protein